MNDHMANELGWMLDEVLKVPEARHAILLSADGMLRAHSQGVARDEAERQAAALSGLQSISRSTAEFCGKDDSPWQQTLVEFADGYVFLVAAGAGAYLAVSSTQDVDMEMVTYRMQKLVDRLGKELTSPPRHDTAAATRPGTTVPS
ncbi:roadblock/LC7 domain-containing protein [Actinacidiphila bryophytorum]|uniref:Predicted regulator of Ras-like GTPase activity, Roadblock/LC7/MglB family n=1 Tax=Actinacidiphila bryophytorum TaxID=1436133 RepID=A0A9W4H0I4_9ACTN|nr:roadblock/LC7 domain-containing protein [Actinacidiphila bryophytorum]MBM9438743.1 roadblock/LC7 domain-containing protein [Actinacidiphila bryophytorum]MBN6547655.1 roadblock/LC7 domain-containing protein [Actinacidiphila bryophytorum]CAG7637779.1 Predicted regulator of Ras-like GTPase activity, Roadblock/LC7/MglB family [Actinacidiphila bryophytorum]